MNLKNKSSSILKFQNLEYNILDGQLNLSALAKGFISDLEKKGYISVIANVKQIDGNHYTLGTRYALDTTSEKDILIYIEYLNSKYAMLENRYKIVPAVTIYFNYTPITDEMFQTSQTLSKGRLKASNALNLLNFKDENPANLPVNTEYFTWSTDTERLGSNVLVVKNLTLDAGTSVSRIIKVNFLDRLTRLIEIFTSDNVYLDKVTDKLQSIFTNNFIRQIGNKFYHVENGKIFFIFEQLFVESKNIPKAKTANKFTMDMLTLDVETFKNDKGEMSIYCVCFYDGVNTHTYFIDEYKSIHVLMYKLLYKLLSREFTQKTIYIHNSSEFDLIFLLRYIAEHPNTKIEPIIKDGKFINLRIKYGPKLSYYINFKDSYFYFLQV